MQEQRWSDERANHLLDAARVVLEAAGGWQTPEDAQDHGAERGRNRNEAKNIPTLSIASATNGTA
jgi:hypothetical protein